MVYVRDLWKNFQKKVQAAAFKSLQSEASTMSRLWVRFKERQALLRQKTHADVSRIKDVD